jgi:Xaa-Pro aminopeptidase
MTGPDFRSRQRKLVASMGKKGVDACLLSDPADVMYYSGYAGLSDDHFFLLVTGRDRPLLIASPLSNEAPHRYEHTALLKKMKDMIEILKPYRKIGFDEEAMSSARFMFLKRSGLKLELFGDQMKEPRIVKEPWEIEQIKKAISVTKKVMDAARHSVFGMTEARASEMIKSEMWRLGAEPAFDPIIASGSQTGFIHHRPNGRVIHPGDLVLIDIGCRLNGYCSDVTRMVCKKPDKDLLKLAGDMKIIDDAIMRKLRPGTRTKEIDNLQKILFRKLNYKEYHRFGHGLGLSVHEDIGDVLKPGVVLTMEPGLYLENKIGFRKEEVVLINKKSCEILTKKI